VRCSVLQCVLQCGAVCCSVCCSVHQHRELTPRDTNNGGIVEERCGVVQCGEVSVAVCVAVCAAVCVAVCVAV